MLSKNGLHKNMIAKKFHETRMDVSLKINELKLGSKLLWLGNFFFKEPRLKSYKRQLIL